jgi:hypothetical protein
MLKNRTIVIAISSALLSLSQVDAAPAATPLTVVRVTAQPTKPLQMGEAAGDFDRAFVVQQKVDNPIAELRTEKPLGTPIWIDHRPDLAAPSTDHSP